MVMIRKIFIAAMLGLVALPLWAGEVIDGIVATVNGHAILQSDWEDEICFEAFLAGQPLDRVTPDARKTALDHLIDQELLREQMQSLESQHVSDEVVGERMREVRKQYRDASSDQGWQALLAQFHLTEKEVKERLGLQLDVMRLVDSKLRPGVQIDDKSIESYYNHEFLPQLHQAGAKDVPLAQVTPKIKELLTQEKMNQLLAAWLQNLRSGSNIRGEGFRPNFRGPAQ